MATTITMPQLGETVTEGTVAQWLKKPGDAIEKYENFVEVSTDKVNAEVPSPVSGVLREIICQEGETVATGAPIAVIDEVGVPAASVPAAPGPEAWAPEASASGVSVPMAPASTGSAAQPAPAAMATNGSANGGASQNGHGAEFAKSLRGMSPAVRRLAREHRVELATVRGTGTNGRVTANDVLAAAERMIAERHDSPPARAATSSGATAYAGSTTERAPAPQAGRTATTSASREAAPQPPGTSTYGKPIPGTLVPLSQARKLIAKRMTESLANAPHAWTMVEVDVTKLMRWRTQEKDRFLADRGYALTLLPFFVYAVVQSLKAQPLLNARFTEDGILVHREINIGVAIGLDTNLIVPVIRDADALSIGGIAVAAGKLIAKARAGTLGADDLGGGTFTVNNTGANGSILSKPIINGGQAGIVTMEAVVKRAVVVEDAIAIRQMMNVCLSLDHRVIDGAVANAFLGELKKRLEAMRPGGDL
jgi:2-oxoisovalerate dehydrogenase E2 component (dihydrolipoyl transacylase)